MQAGDVFGEIALSDGMKRTLDAIATSPTELVIIKRVATELYCSATRKGVAQRL